MIRRVLIIIRTINAHGPRKVPTISTSEDPILPCNTNTFNDTSIFYFCDGCVRLMERIDIRWRRTHVLAPIQFGTVSVGRRGQSPLHSCFRVRYDSVRENRFANCSSAFHFRSYSKLVAWNWTRHVLFVMWYLKLHLKDQRFSNYHHLYYLLFLSFLRLHRMRGAICRRLCLDSAGVLFLVEGHGEQSFCESLSFRTKMSGSRSKSKPSLAKQKNELHKTKLVEGWFSPSTKHRNATTLSIPTLENHP